MATSTAANGRRSGNPGVLRDSLLAGGPSFASDDNHEHCYDPEEVVGASKAAAERLRLPHKWALGGPVGVVILPCVLLVSALVYIIVQWKATGEVIDGGFVGFLLSGTLVGFSGVVHIYHALRSDISIFFTNLDENYICCASPSMAAEVHSRSNQRTCEANAFMDSVFNTCRQIAAGVVVGAAMASASLLLKPWQNEPGVRSAFLFFLFCVNVIVGVLVSSVLQLFVWTTRFGKHVIVKLFDHSNPSADIYVRLCVKMVMLAGTMLCLCVLSLLFSIFDVVGSPLILILAAGNAVALLGILIIPLVPLYKQLESEKIAIRRRLAILRQRKFYDGVLALENDASTVSQISEEQKSFTHIAEELKALELMVKTISRIHTLPQGYMIVQTAASTVVLTGGPYLVSALLKHFG
jgi:uncharacterized membrane protein